MTPFSSWGPTDDGRIKPDVVANGMGVLSSIADTDDAYLLAAGTSSAAANMTGTAALLIQHYENLFSQRPTSATIKGLLIHTAFDAGNPGPDFSYGWGVVDAAAAATFLVNAQFPTPSTTICEDTYTGTEKTYYLENTGTEALEATLSWTDPEGNPQGSGIDVTTSVLVNDLDLWITDPDGITYYPWTLNAASPANPAVRTDPNHVDNVEQVLIDVTEAGIYTIHVGATGSVLNQDFSLLVDALCYAPQPVAYVQTFESGMPGIADGWWYYWDNDGQVDVVNGRLRMVGGGPEIEIRGNSQIIADGDTTPSPNDHTDFGDAYIVNDSVTRTFTIKNIGSKVLNLRGGPDKVIITGSSGFTVTQQPASPVVASGGTTTFEITFDPSSSGTKTAIISIANNDDDENPFDFVIQGQGVLFGSQQIISTQAVSPHSVYASDLDGDGDNDVLSASYDNRIDWYKNLGGGAFGTQQLISNQVDNPNSVYACDLDGDGDNDILSASRDDDKIAWYENLGGGSFGTQQVISTQADWAYSVYACDLDGDGDNDVLSASLKDDKIAWYENLGGGNFGDPADNQQVISTQADGAYSVYACDLDGDGDNDVLSASSKDDKIAWYENLEGGTFGGQQVISAQADGARSVYASDLDGDGDNDVLSASNFDDKIAWYENSSDGTFGPQQVISTQEYGANSVYASDLDGDGDSDVLSTSNDDNKIVWFENLGGGTFGSRWVISNQVFRPTSVYASDLDGDGDKDVLSTSWADNKIAWYENLRTPGVGSPEIDVERNGTDDVHTHAFGIIQVGQSVSQEFTVRNEGDADLVVTQAAGLISPFSISPVNNGGSTDDWVIPTGRTQIFTVSFSPGSPGDYSDTLVLTSNDADEGSYQIAVQGTGTALAPVVQALPYTQDFSVGQPTSADGWEYYVEGRIAVVDGRLRMDGTGTYDLNEAILHVDLKGLSNVQLTLDHDSVSDENNAMLASFTGHFNGDGIALSVDGIHWVTVGSLTTDFTAQIFYLDAVVAQAQAEAGSSDLSYVRIKFQQYDNGAVPYDGREFDNIVVESQTTNSLKEAILHVDLSGTTYVALTLDHWNLSDESDTLPDSFDGHYNGDGIVLSVDGQNWVKITDLTTDFMNQSFDLEPVLQQAQAAAGSSDLSRVRIKFQQYGNDSASSYGREFDNIMIIIGPEIEVLGNSQEILDGDTTPSPSDHTNFGNCYVPSGSVTRTFTISNMGLQDLILTGSPDKVIITGSTDFTVTQQPSSPVAANGGTTTFEITFDPSSSGTKTATISIANDDYDEDPYDFVIQGTGSFFGGQQVISTQANGAYSVYACDIDGDGDNDVLSASVADDKIAWYENQGGGTFSSVQQVISTQADGARWVYACDLDGDGDNDVLSASVSDDKIAWYENRLNDLTADFGPQQVISTQADGAASVYACDLDGDGDNDVLSASAYDDKIAWYENSGDGTFGPQQAIGTDVDYAASVYACDLDGDGDNDVLSASRYNDRIAWYENNGSGTFGGKQSISTQPRGPMSVYACDLDGDGDNDVLSASYFDDVIAWYENRLNEQTADFGSQQVISRWAADGAHSVYACDLDGDGDNDVLSASWNDNKVAWYENLSGGTFGDQQVISTQAGEVRSVYACDLDGDGDNDVLSASYLDDKIAWYENLGTPSQGPQSLPYSQDFDSGQPGMADGWEYYTEGRIAVVDGHLRMDATGAYSLNEAILHVDLTGLSNVQLTLDHWSLLDEEDDLSASFTDHSNGDGIALSVDGIHWVTVSSLTTDFTAQIFYLDAVLAQAQADAGSSDLSDVRIKFQQYDDGAAPNDGREFDNVEVSAPAPVAQAFPYTQDFSFGQPTSANGWEYYAEGRIAVVDESLRMDATGAYSLNEAILHVDLTGLSNVQLTLDHGSLSDENNALPASFTGHS
ncbi:MAG: hypothetical protein AMJ46_14285, partial [Latescibacteria bacterium DG_63]